MRWMRRWRERNDQSLVKPSALVPDIDPIEELSRILGEANADSSGAIVAFASQTTRAEAYACNDRHYVNSSGHVAHLPSCGSEPFHREAISRDGSVSFGTPSRDVLAS